MRFTPFAIAATAASLTLMASAPLTAQVATGVSASWRDDVGGSFVNINNGGATKQVRWGGNVGSGQSGYNFTPNALGSINPLTPPGTLFTLGTFVHLNNPISTGTSINSIILDFSLTIAGASPSEDFTESFVFNHLETPNGNNPCANGEALGAGVNVNGCADRVTFAFAGSATPFSFGGDDFFLEIVGFSVGGGSAVSQFWTIEEQDNSAQLIGRLTGVDPSIPVPEPASTALLLAGVVGLGMMARRHRIA